MTSIPIIFEGVKRLDHGAAKPYMNQSSIPDDWRILLVNPSLDTDTPNFISKIDTKTKYRWIDAYTPAMGIRFIKENFQGVDILEYPTMLEYKNHLFGVFRAPTVQ